MVTEHADNPQPGWLAWALETRNQAVHRGQLLRVLLNRPSQRRPGDPQFLVPTRTPVQYLMRVQQHIRRRPWLPDMHALVSGRDVDELWLTDPAQVTLRLPPSSRACARCQRGLVSERHMGHSHGFVSVASRTLAAAASRVKLAD